MGRTGSNNEVQQRPTKFICNDGFQGVVLKGHSKRINKIKFKARSDLVATVSDDKTRLVWKVKTGEKISKLKCKNRVIFWRDHEDVILGSYNGNIHCWRVSGEAGEEGWNNLTVKAKTRHGKDVLSSMSLNKNNTLLASCSLGTCIHFLV